MNESAHVRNLDALADAKAALASFRSQAGQGLLASDLEIRRMLEWLSHDQTAYWKAEIRRREDQVTHAKADLNRARIAAVFGDTPQCADQQLALKKAICRLEDARDKLKSVGRWLRVLETEAGDYRGPAQQLQLTLDAHLVQAGELLDRLLLTLEGYVYEAG